MPLAHPSIEADASILEALDFQPRCEHSRHHDLKHQHDDGPATHVIRLIHVCTPDSSGTDYYGCAKWAAFLMSGKTVVCVRCNERMRTDQLAIPIATL